MECAFDPKKLYPEIEIFVCFCMRVRVCARPCMCAYAYAHVHGREGFFHEELMRSKFLPSKSRLCKPVAAATCLLILLLLCFGKETWKELRTDNTEASGL